MPTDRDTLECLHCGCLETTHDDDGACLVTVDGAACACPGLEVSALRASRARLSFLVPISAALTDNFGQAVLDAQVVLLRLERLENVLADIAETPEPMNNKSAALTQCAYLKRAAKWALADA